MFGKNEIVGQKYFRTNAESNAGKLFVTSVFLTLQGEGPYSGMPAVFVRLAKCNLNCSFCDTFFDDGDWLTTEQLKDKIWQTIIDFHQVEPDDTREIERLASTIVLVITGGEPMLQENLGPFLAEVAHKFRATQIESNGTIWQELPDSTTLVCSPKCSEKSGKYLAPHAKVLDRLNCLKFVISADPDSPYHTIPDWAVELSRLGLDVYVSPMNIYNDAPMKSKQLRMETNQISLKQRSEIDEVVSFWEPGLLNMEKNQANHEYAAKYALKNGFRLNLQIHLLASLA